MDDPSKKNLKKQASLTCIEQSLKMISSPQQAPVTIYPGPKPSLQNLSKADLEIADRLEKLRKSSTAEIPSEEEMATRLAHLKGLPFNHYTKPHQFAYQTDNRSQFEKSDDLLKQVMNEVALEQKLPKFEDEIEARLSNLKGLNRDSPNLRQVKNAKSETYEDQAFLSSIGTDTADIDFREITKSVRDSNEEAKKALASLDGDTEIAAAIAQACAEIKEKKIKKYRKKSKHEKKNSTSDEERYSASDSEFPQKTSNSEEASKEKEEVDRIVKLYTEKEKLRKERKKEKRKKLADNGKSSESDLSSSESDIFTSESEKSSID